MKWILIIYIIRASNGGAGIDHIFFETEGQCEYVAEAIIESPFPGTWTKTQCIPYLPLNGEQTDE